MNQPRLISVDEALQTLLADATRAAQCAVTRLEQVDLFQVNGRVLAMDVPAGYAVPPYAISTMDGYALRAAEIVPGQVLPVSQRIAAGQVGQPLAVGTVARIFTGAPIPAGADVVIMQEQAILGAAGVSFAFVPAVGENIRALGADIQAGQILFSAGQRVRAVDAGLLASVGIAQITVRERLRVGIFCTGDELVDPGETLLAGKIYNSNRYFLLPLLEQLGCVVTDYGNVRDNLTQTQDLLERAALEQDVILTVGGVSVGEEDHVKAAVQNSGELNLWAIAVKPGKPLAFGRLGAAGFLGLPGNPVSAFVTFLLFVRPYLLRRMGVQQVLPTALPLAAAFSWPTVGARVEARREFLRARINENGQVEIFANQQSGVLSSCAWADGLVDNPPKQTVAPGDLVSFIPLAALLN